MLSWADSQAVAACDDQICTDPNSAARDFDDANAILYFLLAQDIVENFPIAGICKK